MNRTVQRLAIEEEVELNMVIADTLKGQRQKDGKKGELSDTRGGGGNEVREMVNGGRKENKKGGRAGSNSIATSVGV